MISKSDNSNPASPDHLASLTPSVCGKVLYIEDTQANINLMRMILKRLPGIDLKDARSAEEGINLAKQEQPDLILMDISLPGMDGVQALQILRGDEATRNIPVIAISAAATPHDIERITNAGFDNFLSKPFNVLEIPDFITRYLS